MFYNLLSRCMTLRKKTWRLMTIQRYGRNSWLFCNLLLDEEIVIHSRIWKFYLFNPKEPGSDQRNDNPSHGGDIWKFDHLAGYSILSLLYITIISNAKITKKGKAKTKLLSFSLSLSCEELRWFHATFQKNEQFILLMNLKEKTLQYKYLVQKS